MRSVSFSVLRERSLALYVASVTVSTLGSSMASVALAFAVLAIGTPSDLGFVLVAREVPIVAFLLLGGVWADRVSRQRLLVVADVARGLAQGAGALLLLTGTASVWKLAALQVAFGIADAFSRPATVGIVAQIAAPEALQRANSLISLSRSTLRVAGPAAGAAIVVAASPGWALAGDALTFAVSAILLATLRLPGSVRTAGAGVIGDLRDGWREFSSRTWVWVMVVSFGLFQLTAFPALFVLGPYVAKTELGGAGAWGTLLAFSAGGAFLGGLIGLRFRPARPLVTSCLLCVPMAVLLALIGEGVSLWALAPVGMVASGCLDAADIYWQTTLQQKVPAHAISRVASFDWLGSVVLNPIGFALVGPLSDAAGVPATLLGAAALNGAVSIAIASVPAIRAVRPGAEAAVAPAVA
jgi:MFS family permease